MKKSLFSLTTIIHTIILTTNIWATEPNSVTVAATAAPQQEINCNYHIPPATPVEQKLVMQWAEKALIQSFNFEHNKINDQLDTLKNCFTEEGWKGFNEALKTSGNLEAIKNQKLMVNAMPNGESKIMEEKTNQWKLTYPLQVVYQNEKEKVKQSLVVSVLVGRKSSGDLGIMQVIAVPQHPGSITAAPANNTSQKP